MGVDAVMFVAVPALLDAVTVRRTSADLAEAFYADTFGILQPGEWEWAPTGRHALEIVTKADDYTEILAANGALGEAPQALEVHLSGRYYGLDYERGNWPLFDSIRKWLQARIPESRVFYGGDSSDVLDEMTPAFCDDLWRHFATVGHTPYTNAFNRGGKARICAFCADRPMDAYGSSGNGHYAAYRCDGCGLDEVTRDGGATWMSRKDDEAKAKKERV